MKYCVSSRQPHSTKLLADELFVSWSDRDVIMDFIEAYPDKSIILECEHIQEKDWPVLSMYNEKINLMLGIAYLDNWYEAKERGFKVYRVLEVNTYYELQALVNMGADAILIGPPLTFDLKKVSSFGVPLRMIANTSALAQRLPHENNICGQWVRPEDVQFYEPYVDTLEFWYITPAQERNLLHIYKDNQKWPGNLNLLFNNFGINVDNRALPADLGERRINCGQRCMANGICRKCESAIKWSETLRKIHTGEIQRS